MHYIIYLSTGTSWFTEVELQQILAVSIANNRRDNITGLLLYSDGNFIQLLEGEESDVMQTYKRVTHDPRHTGVTHVASGPLAERNFPEWAMGFKSVEKGSLIPFNDILSPESQLPDSGKNSHISVKLLKAFMKTARM